MVTIDGAGILHSPDVHAHGLKSVIWYAVSPQAKQGEQFFHAHAQLMGGHGLVVTREALNITLRGID